MTVTVPSSRLAIFKSLAGAVIELGNDEHCFLPAAFGQRFKQLWAICLLLAVFYLRVFGCEPTTSDMAQNGGTLCLNPESTDSLLGHTDAVICNKLLQCCAAKMLD